MTDNTTPTSSDQPWQQPPSPAHQKPWPLVFGHVAAGDIKQTGKRGRGMAIAGLVLGYVVVGLAVLVLLAEI